MTLTYNESRLASYTKSLRVILNLIGSLVATTWLFLVVIFKWRQRENVHAGLLLLPATTFIWTPCGLTRPVAVIVFIVVVAIIVDGNACRCL